MKRKTDRIGRLCRQLTGNPAPALQVVTLLILLALVPATAAQDLDFTFAPSMQSDEFTIPADGLVTAPTSLSSPADDDSRFTLPPEPSTAAPPQTQDSGLQSAASLAATPQPRTWQVLPAGLIYRSYLAGEKEARMASTWVYERDWGWMWDITLGGRAGLIRYGTTNANVPEGFQIDLEAAAQPRLDIEHMEDLIATDYRFGVPITFGNRRFQVKLAAYHLSSHMGDELMVLRHSFHRLNYSRNALVWGNSYFWTDVLRFYAEAAWAFYGDGGSEPWEFQFGIEYAPREPTGLRPVPFVAINSHLRQEVDYGGNLVVQSGWAWRGGNGQMFRVGMQYYTGKSDQYEFYNEFEDKLGLGLWYDF